MAQVWQCDRCKVVSDMGNVDEPPEGWEEYRVPVRGSEGARSTMNMVLCSGCEDSMYRWLHRQDANLATVVKQAANLMFNLAQGNGPLDASHKAQMRTAADSLDTVTKALGGNPSTAAWDLGRDS